MRTLWRKMVSAFLAKELVTVNGELSKYFGAENGNVNSDAFHRALLNDAKIDEYLAASSADSNAMDSGYARGYNRYIDTHADQLLHPALAQSGSSPLMNETSRDSQLE